MRIRNLAVLVLVLFSNFAFAENNTKASEASINELLAVTNVRATVDNVLPQMQNMMKTSMQQALKGNSPTPEQQARIDKVQAQMTKFYQEEMSWDHMRPMYVRIYQESLTEDEVQGMLKFYRSPAGQAMVKKMPVIMQNTMIEMQKMVVPMVEKMRAAAREAQSTGSDSTKANTPAKTP